MISSTENLNARKNQNKRQNEDQCARTVTCRVNKRKKKKVDKTEEKTKNRKRKEFESSIIKKKHKNEGKKNKFDINNFIKPVKKNNNKVSKDGKFSEKNEKQKSTATSLSNEPNHPGLKSLMELDLDFDDSVRVSVTSQENFKPWKIVPKKRKRNDETDENHPTIRTEKNVKDKITEESERNLKTKKMKLSKKTPIPSDNKLEAFQRNTSPTLSRVLRSGKRSDCPSEAQCIRPTAKIMPRKKKTDISDKSTGCGKYVEILPTLHGDENKKLEILEVVKKKNIKKIKDLGSSKKMMRKKPTVQEQILKKLIKEERNLKKSDMKRVHKLKAVVEDESNVISTENVNIKKSMEKLKVKIPEVAKGNRERKEPASSIKKTKDLGSIKKKKNKFDLRNFVKRVKNNNQLSKIDELTEKKKQKPRETSTPNKRKPPELESLELDFSPVDSEEVSVTSEDNFRHYKIVAKKEKLNEKKLKKQSKDNAEPVEKKSKTGNKNNIRSKK